MWIRAIQFGSVAGLVWGLAAIWVGDKLRLNPKLFHLIGFGLLAGVMVGILISLVMVHPLKWVSTSHAAGPRLRPASRFAAAALGIAMVPLACSLWGTMTATFQYFAWHQMGWGIPVHWQWEPGKIALSMAVVSFWIWWLFPLAVVTTLMLQTRLRRAELAARM